MSQRFNVIYWTIPRGLNRRFKGYQSTGWVVCDGHERITIIFATKEEAEKRRDNIAALYTRFGW